MKKDQIDKKEPDGRKSAEILLVLLLIVSMAFSGAPVFAESGQGVNQDTVKSVMDDTASYVYKTVKDPQVGSIGGEWAVLGLARAGITCLRNIYPGIITIRLLNT